MLRIGEIDFCGRRVVKCAYRIVKCPCGTDYKTWVAIDEHENVLDKRNWLCPTCTRQEESEKNFHTRLVPGVYRTDLWLQSLRQFLT